MSCKKSCLGMLNKKVTRLDAGVLIIITYAVPRNSNCTLRRGHYYCYITPLLSALFLVLFSTTSYPPPPPSPYLLVLAEEQTPNNWYKKKITTYQQFQCYQELCAFLIRQSKALCLLKGNEWRLWRLHYSYNVLFADYLAHKVTAWRTQRPWPHL